MPKLFTDYYSQTALTIPPHFIDVKSGETLNVSTEIFKQVEYHAENQTLIHLLLSALHEYFHPIKKGGLNEELFMELAEIKKMLQESHMNKEFVRLPPRKEQHSSADLDIKEVDDILEVFGG